MIKWMKHRPYLEWIYERWRLLVTNEGDIECIFAANKKGDTAVFVTRDGSPIARIVAPGDLDEWSPSFGTSEALNEAFVEASQDDWRRTLEDFTETSAPVVKRLNQYIDYVRNINSPEREDC